MDIKTLVNKIIDNISDNKYDISDLLREVNILAFKLDNETLKIWVSKEVNGYNVEDALPKYRKMSTVLFGSIEQDRGFGGSLLYNKYPLPISHLPKKTQDIITEWDCIMPIGAIQSVIKERKGQDLSITCSNSVIGLVAKGLADNVYIHKVWRELQEYDLVNVIDSVKNRVLQFLLELDREMKLDANFISSERDKNMKTQRIIGSTIYAGIANFGDNASTDLDSSSINVNENINQDAIKKLSNIIKQIEQTNIKHEDALNLLTQIKEELSTTKNRSKLKVLFQALLGVATEVSANIITPFVKEALSIL